MSEVSKDDLIINLVDNLVGTGESLENYLEQNDASHLTDDNDFLQHLDTEAFNCADCGWWCEMGEVRDRDGENVCQDCKPEDDED